MLRFTLRFLNRPTLTAALVSTVGATALFIAGCGSSYDATELQRCGGQPCESSTSGTLPSGTSNGSANGSDDDGTVTTAGTNKGANKANKDGGTVKTTCSYSSECGGDRICANGACLAVCESSDACAAGSTCEKGVCVPSSAPGVSCADDTGCASGEYCASGTCAIDTRPAPNCNADVDCGDGPAPKKCLGGFCKFTCSSDLACKQIDSRIGYCAPDNVCRTSLEASPECISSDECADKSCIGNRCL